MAPARTSNRRAPKSQQLKPTRQRPSRAAHSNKETNADQHQQQIQLLLNAPAAEPDPPPDNEHESIFIDPRVWDAPWHLRRERRRGQR